MCNNLQCRFFSFVSELHSKRADIVRFQLRKFSKFHFVIKFLKSDCLHQIHVHVPCCFRERFAKSLLEAGYIRRAGSVCLDPGMSVDRGPTQTL